MTADGATGPATGPDYEVSRQLTDPAMIRALSHPARLSIVEHLSATGTAATATELAAVVGLSPSATSYHLRAMAEHGLVEEAESRGDGRERRWRGIGSGLQLEHDPTPGERRTAEKALVAAVLARSNERVNTWLSQVASEPAEWRNVTGINDSMLAVTPAELAEIVAGYQELIRPYQRRSRLDPPDEARPVSAHLRMVPMPG